MSNTSVEATETKVNYQGQFVITRHNDRFAAIIPTSREYEVNTYRKSARRSYAVLEPVAGTGESRIEMTVTEARALVEAMQAAGRAPVENVEDLGDGRWQYVVNPYEDEAYEEEYAYIHSHPGNGYGL